MKELRHDIQLLILFLRLKFWKHAVLKARARAVTRTRHQWTYSTHVVEYDASTMAANLWPRVTLNFDLLTRFMLLPVDQFTKYCVDKVNRQTDRYPASLN